MSRKLINIKNRDLGNIKCYCLSCREHHYLKDPEIVTLKKNHNRAIKGRCKECSTVVYRMLPKKK